MKRRRARESAFILVFESLFLNLNATELVEDNQFCGALRLNEYSRKLVFGVVGKRDELIDRLRPFLKNWKSERISCVLLAILQIALYEIIYIDDVDSPVAINEAVELTKRYFGEEGSAFVNGVLGSFVKSLQTLE